MKQKKNSWLRVFAICLVGGLLLVVLSLQLQESSETSSQEMSSSSQIIESEFITFYGIDTDEVLLNPGKGLVLRSYPDSTFDPAFLDKIAIGYTRFDWSEIEPEGPLPAPAQSHLHKDPERWTAASAPVFLSHPSAA